MSNTPVKSHSLTPRIDEPGVYCGQCRAFRRVTGTRRNGEEIGFRCEGDSEGKQHELFIVKTGESVPMNARFELDLRVTQ